MRNVSMTVEGDTLVIKVKLSSPSSYVTGSGRNAVLASTEGNVLIPGTDIRLGLNCYQPVRSCPIEFCSHGTVKLACCHCTAPIGRQAKPVATVAVAVSEPVTINDYTCGCGNTKCSKTEKSCWKCGAPIKP